MTDKKNIPDPASLRVRVLPEHVARKIAAGEVIDRPNAVVRELLDNAVDSGADEITLSLEGGGIDSVSVTDNGCGMTLEDLESCWLPHATSKITSVDDLELVRTLGFRGEALSSMAACARLEITTNREGEAQKLTVHGGKLLGIMPHRGAPGTTVTVKDLFFNMPARRRFLKSSRGEITMCRRVFLEKAAAHPTLAFRLFIDGVMKSYLPRGSHLERIQSAWPGLATSWWETAGSGDGFDIIMVHPRPEISRKDRQYIQIYTNRRRIDEYSLVQGVQHAYDQWMPGGAFPLAFVFIEIDPSLVDFNIHPAKKEARFRDLPSVRHRMTDLLKDRITGESYQQRARYPDGGTQQILLSREKEGFESKGVSGNYHAGNTSRVKSPYNRAPEETADDFGRAAGMIRKERPPGGRLERSAPVSPSDAADFRYLGQVMGVFLLAESSGSLYVVDQHAAHERILYDRFRNSGGVSERLLIPREIHPERDALMRLELRKERLAAMGIEVEEEGGQWYLRAMPRSAAGMEENVVEFLEAGEGDPDGLEKALWADLACKAAIKDNSVLDEQSARSLLSEAFALETPRCPHGRPIWFEVSRTELFDLVGRTV